MKLKKCYTYSEYKIRKKGKRSVTRKEFAINKYARLDLKMGV